MYGPSPRLAIDGDSTRDIYMIMNQEELQRKAQAMGPVNPYGADRYNPRIASAALHLMRVPSGATAAK